MSKSNRTLSSRKLNRYSCSSYAIAGMVALSASLSPWLSQADENESPLPPNVASGKPVDVTTDSDKGALSEASGNSGKGPGSADAKDGSLDQYMANRGTAKFSGRPITLQLRNVDAVDVFRLISEASGFNIILSDEVKGSVTLSLSDVPWDQALDVVLHTLHLGAERNNNILRITTLSSLTVEKQEQLQARKASEATAPKITKVFPISYANLSDLSGVLTKFLSGSDTNSASSGSAAVVQADSRTNSLIIRDLPENIERARKLIEALDTQTPQVLVEAKIVEATEGFSKSITGSLGTSGSANSNANQFGASFAGSNPSDPLIGSPGIFADGTAFSGGSAGGATFGGSLSPASLRFLPGIRRLNAILNMGESENQVKILSSPRTVVMNKQSASIVQGTPVLVPTVTAVAGAGTSIGNTVQNANLSLSVTPTVTNDGGVLMQLTVTRDIPFVLGTSTAVANRNINTTVLVESGSTLVIGGIYTMSTSHVASGFPFLRKIPILGAFFGNEADQTDRSELFIFVTPRILNAKEAGLTG